jgi:L-threonylcarbamoyladenylate synthase
MDIAAAADLLRLGHAVAIPTETVYGLAADATNPAAIAEIYRLKGRPGNNPLISHVASLAEAERHGDFTPDARRLAQMFWPGPLTLILPFRPTSAICPATRAHLPTVALRVPSHPTAQALLQQLPFPLAAPSANRSGHVSATLPAHIRDDFGDSLPLVEDGPSPLGLESTVIALLPDARPRLLRPGPLFIEEIEAVLGQPLLQVQNETPATLMSPGQMLSHYAPQAPVRLEVTTVLPGEALLAFGPRLPDLLPPQTVCLNLSQTANLHEAGQNLYRMLRALDAHHPAGIAVMPLYVEPAGMLDALTNRLRRAAA